MEQMILFILSIICTSVGLFFCLLYLNLLTIGYTFSDFVYFIIRRIECDFLFVGIILFWFSMKRKGLRK